MRTKLPSKFELFSTVSRLRGLRISQYVIFTVLLTSCACLPAQTQDAVNVSPAAADNSSSTLPDDPSVSADRQSESAGQRLGTIGKTIGEDELHFIKAPFKKSAIKWDILFVGSTAALISTDERVLHDVPDSWHQTSHDIANGSLYGTAGIAAGIYFTGLITKDEHAQETGIRTAEATVDSVIMYGALKVITQRQRPFTGEGEGRFFAGNWKNGSFPSGHAMFAWTVASSVAHQYHSIPLDLAMYGLASTVSVTRVTAGLHFPSDVFVGSIFGYLIGDYVAHKNESGFPIRSEGKFGRARDAVLQHVVIGVQ